MSKVAAWPTFMAKLRNRQEVAERTISFSFEKLADRTFRAGQFIDITLINPAETDTEGNTRGFSVSSAPYEEAITITTRMRYGLQAYPRRNGARYRSQNRRPVR